MSNRHQNPPVTKQQHGTKEKKVIRIGCKPRFNLETNQSKLCMDLKGLNKQHHVICAASITGLGFLTKLIFKKLSWYSLQSVFF